MSDGFNLGIIGASIEARANVFFSFGTTGYSRRDGIATLTLASGQYVWLPGRKFRVANNNEPNIEGNFTALTCTGNPSVITYVDRRPDKLTTLVGGGQVHDLQAYAFTSGYPMYISIATGGRVNPTIFASGGTTLSDWTDDRLAQFLSNGPFNTIYIGGGLMGNSLKGVQTLGAEQAISQLREIVNTLSGACRTLLVASFPSNRQITAASDPTFVAGSRAARKLYRDLVKDYPNVKIVPIYDVLSQNHNLTTVSADLDNGWPPATSMQDDGTHFRNDAARKVGTIIGRFCNEGLTFFVPEMGIKPDSRLVNSGFDSSGLYKMTNIAEGFYGTVATTTATAPATGLMPTSCYIGVTNAAGGMTAVSSVVTNPEGGNDWQLVVTDNAGIANGSGVTMAYTGVTNSLLTKLNDSSVQGKDIDIYMPLTLNITTPQSIQYCEITLKATVSGTQYVLAAAALDDGSVKQGTSNAMQAGFSGVVRFPRFKLPVGTYTFGATDGLQFAIKTKASTPSGITTMKMGGGMRVDVVD